MWYIRSPSGRGDDKKIIICGTHGFPFILSSLLFSFWPHDDDDEYLGVTWLCVGTSNLKLETHLASADDSTVNRMSLKSRSSCAAGYV